MYPPLKVAASYSISNKVLQENKYDIKREIISTLSHQLANDIVSREEFHEEVVTREESPAGRTYYELQVLVLTPNMYQDLVNDIASRIQLDRPLFY